MSQFKNRMGLCKVFEKIVYFKPFLVLACSNVSLVES